MREIPDNTDLTELSKACDRVIRHMRQHYGADDPASEIAQDIEAMAYICKFLYKIKDNIEFIENMVQILKAAKLDEK